MHEFVLKGKRHQIFTAFFVPQLILGLVPNFNANVELAKLVLIAMVYVVWIVMLGRSLNLCIPRRHRLKETSQQVFLFLFVLIFVPLIMFMDLGVIFRGNAMIIPSIMVFGYLYQFYFASKALKSAEKGKKSLLNEHLWTMFLLLFAWIGIWFIQPRINKVWEKNKERFEETD